MLSVFYYFKFLCRTIVYLYTILIALRITQRASSNASLAQAGTTTTTTTTVGAAAQLLTKEVIDHHIRNRKYLCI